MKKLFDKLSSLIKERMRDSFWTRIALVLSIIVVFCTTYALVLPALTLTTSSSNNVLQEEAPAETSSEEIALQESSTSQTESSSVENAATSETSSSSAVEETQTESSSQPEQADEEEVDPTQAGEFTKEADNVVVKVTYGQDTFAEKVSLKVTPIKNTSAIEEKLKSELAKENRELTTSHSYDISFVNAAGKEIEPAKEVSVSMTFKSDLSKENERQEGWKLYHFIDDKHQKVEDLTDEKATDIKETEDGAVNEVVFKSDTFSTYTIAGKTYEDFADYLTGASYVTSPKPTYNSGTKLLSTTINLNYHFEATQLRVNPRYALELPADTTWTDVTLGMVYTGKEGSTDAYHYQLVEENGKKYMVIEFLDAYIRNSGITVSGNIEYKAELGESLRDSQNNYHVEYSDKAKVDIPSSGYDQPSEPVQSEYDLKSEKSGNLVYDGDEAYIDYVVTISSTKGTKNDINVKDVLSTYELTIGDFEKTSIIKRGANGGTQNLTSQVNLTPTKTSSYGNQSSTFETTLPKLNAGESYTIRYRYKISDIKTSSRWVENKVDVTSQDTPSPGQVSVTKEVVRNSVEKSGYFNQDTNTITWKITINKNGNDIAGAVLSDVMLSQALPGTLVISPNRNNVVQESDGTLRFIAVGSTGKNTNTYTIEYSTDAGIESDSWQSSTVISNEAVLNDNGEESRAIYHVTISPEKTNDIKKEFVSQVNTDDDNIKILNWKVTIGVPGNGGIPKGTTFTDEVKGNGYASTGHYYTKSQLLELNQKLESIFGKGNFILKAKAYRGKDSSQPEWGNVINVTSDMADEHYEYFELQLINDYRTGNSEVVLEYSSTGDLSEENRFNNTFDKHTADYTISTGKVTKEDSTAGMGTYLGDNRYNPADETSYTVSNGNMKTISWAARVALTETSKKVTITDTLPEGVDWNLVKLDFGRLYNMGTAVVKGNRVTGERHGVKIEGVIENGTITITATATNGGPLRDAVLMGTDRFRENFYLVYTFDLPQESPLDDDIVKKFKNSIRASIDDQFIGSDDQTQTITYKPGQKVQKNGTWNNNSREVDYVIAINPEALDLHADSDTLVMTDTLTYAKNSSINLSYDLKQGSVKLYTMDDEEVTDGWSWTVKKEDDGDTVKSIMTIEVPDGKAYKLKYSYGVSKDNDDDMWMTVNNTASISGLKTGADTDSTNVNWQKASTTGTAVTEKKYQITKVDADNFRTVLPGALFSVYENGNEDAVATYRTNEEGVFNVFQALNGANTKTVDKLKENTLYYIEETEPPKGYAKTSDTKYYFYFSESNTLPTNLDGFTGDIKQVHNLTQQSRQGIVSNEKRVLITVKKEWQDVDGNKTNRSSGNIDVTLKRYTDNVANSETVETRQIAANGGQWMSDFDGLPRADANGNTYTYFVEETPVSGYDTTYSSDKTSSTKASDVTSTGGEITITNKAQKAYNLPKTGGSGAQSLVIAGLTISGLAALLLLLKSYKNQEGNGL